MKRIAADDENVDFDFSHESQLDLPQETTQIEVRWRVFVIGDDVKVEAIPWSWSDRHRESSDVNIAYYNYLCVAGREQAAYLKSMDLEDLKPLELKSIKTEVAQRCGKTASKLSLRPKEKYFYAVNPCVTGPFWTHSKVALPGKAAILLQRGDMLTPHERWGLAEPHVYHVVANLLAEGWDDPTPRRTRKSRVDAPSPLDDIDQMRDLVRWDHALAYVADKLPERLHYTGIKISPQDIADIPFVAHVVNAWVPPPSFGLW